MFQAFVGYRNSIQFHVFELTRQLPRFSMYSLLEEEDNVPESYVEFKISERLQRICIWINQNFLLPDDIEFESGPAMKLNLRCLRDGSNVQLNFNASGLVQIVTKHMLLAADLVQSLSNFLKLENLEVTIKLGICRLISKLRWRLQWGPCLNAITLKGRADCIQITISSPKRFSHMKKRG